MKKDIITIEVEKRDDTTNKVVKLNDEVIFRSEMVDMLVHSDNDHLLEIVRRAIIEINGVGSWDSFLRKII